MAEEKTMEQTNVADVLLQEEKISAKQRADFLQRAQQEGKPLYKLLQDLKVVPEEDLAKARAALLEIPYIDLKGTKIPDDVIGIVPSETAKNYEFVPFSLENKIIKIAMVDPENFNALEAVEFITRPAELEAKIYITTNSSLDYALTQYKSIKKEVGEALGRATIELDEDKKQKDLSGTDVERIIEEAPISEAVNVILRHAVAQRASDIHIEPMENEVRVRYRVDGILQTSLTLPRKVLNAIVARIKVLSNLKIDEQRIPQDGRFDMKIDGKDIDFRVSTLPVTGGEKVVMRVLDKSRGSYSLEELGLKGKAMEMVIANIKKPYGMVLITGPTGSGKSTTLYSLLEILNQVGVNIVTLEDPVEYFIEGINQSQINPNVGLSFASGLRSILRQDPDIIMVGEIRDRETAEMAVHSALTGHVMLSTLHTNDAIGAIPRLEDMNIEPFLLTASLNLVIAQRLVRRICPHCKEEMVPSPKLKDELMKEIRNLTDSAKKEISGKVNLDNPKFYKGKGCRYCQNEGYQGRIGIFEVFEMKEGMRDLVLKNASKDELYEQARKSGMVTIKEDGMIKVLEGRTTIEEVMRVTKM